MERISTRLRPAHGGLTTHWDTFDEEITYDQYRAWLESAGWHEHHPAGYGPAYVEAGFERGDRWAWQENPSKTTKSADWSYAHWNTAD